MSRHGLRTFQLYVLELLTGRTNFDCIHLLIRGEEVAFGASSARRSRCLGRPRILQPPRLMRSMFLFSNQNLIIFKGHDEDSAKVHVILERTVAPPIVMPAGQKLPRLFVR